MPSPESVTPDEWTGERTNRTKAIALTLGVVVLMVILIVLVAASSSGSSGSPGSSGDSLPTYQPAQDVVPPYRAGTTAARYPATTAAYSPTPAADPEGDALRQLARLHDQDAGAVRFAGQYVAQLASKNVGIVDQYQTAADGTHAFRATDILAEHLDLRRGDNRGATVALVLSTDFGTRRLYNGAPLWMTVADGGFGSAADVTAWCATRFPALSGVLLQDHCAPRRLEAPVG